MTNFQFLQTYVELQQGIMFDETGKLATMYGVSQSKKNGNIIHSIATEEGTYPNQFYKRIGFETKFTSILMVKE